MSLVDEFGNPLTPSKNPVEEVRRLQGIISNLRLNARYDAAQTTTSNERHWANADLLDPHSSNNPAARQNLRSRSRYEVIENNPYLKGMVMTLANDFVGSGPRLEIIDNSYTEEQKTRMQILFNAWSKKIKLRNKLWRMRIAKIVDGEAFGLEINNRRIKHPVQTDWKLVEGDQCTSDGYDAVDLTTNETDGIRFDENDEPTQYHFLKRHPGSSHITPINTKFGEWVDEQFVIHWFRRERAWLRGIPETAPVLSTCALLRIYTLAVVQAAEIAADFAAILESTVPPAATNYGDEDDPFDTFPIDRGMFVTMPRGYKMSQLKAQQPVDVYDKFVDALMREIARPFCMPFNIAVGFSGGYNLASGALDARLYQGAIKQERLDAEDEVVEPMIDAWWFEATRLPDYLGQGTLFSPEMPVPKHVLHWDNAPTHQDPQKVANATVALWENGFLTDEDVVAGMHNKDIDAHYAAIEKQNANRERLGLPLPGADIAHLGIEKDQFDEED